MLVAVATVSVYRVVVPQGPIWVRIPQAHKPMARLAPRKSSDILQCFSLWYKDADKREREEGAPQQRRKPLLVCGYGLIPRGWSDRSGKLDLSGGLRRGLKRKRKKRRKRCPKNEQEKRGSRKRGPEGAFYGIREGWQWKRSGEPSRD